MKKTLNVLIILAALPMLVLGLRTMIDPTSMIEKLGTEPIENTGLNSLRSMFPGVLLGGPLMMIIGVWKNNTAWFLATALLMLVAAFGRLVSFVFDGFDAASVGPTVYEVVVAALLIAAHKFN